MKIIDYHIPVMKKEVLEYLVTDKKGVYCDVTVGGAGHSSLLLEAFSDITLISSDWDINATKHSKKKLEHFGERSQVVYGAFDELEKILKQTDFDKVNGILADFGTSQNQIINNDGFSFNFDTFLDMRMSKGYFKITAFDIINHYPEKMLADIFFNYGEERHSRKIARAIVEERKKKRIKTTLHLVSIVREALNLSDAFTKINPATRVFQALRIEVNQELKQIKTFLNKVPNFLLPGGRLVCISFHSLEDVLVKNFMKEHKDSMQQVVKGILKPTAEEIKENNASRSAIMRVLERI